MLLSVAILLGCFSAVLAGTLGVNINDSKYPFCPMEELANNYFHSVTCEGFVRVKMYGLTREKLNEKVDNLLQDAKAQRVTFGSCEIRSFYFNETAWLFVKMPDLTQNSSKITDRNVSFWITDLRDKEGFIPFPSSEWTFLAKGFTANEFDEMTAEEWIKQKAICDPQNWYFDMIKQKLKNWGSQGWFSLTNTSIREKTAHCSPLKQYVLYDPIQVKRSNGSEEVKDFLYFLDHECRKEIMTQAYDDLAMYVMQGESGEYHFSYARNESCYLRKASHDLGELPHWFMVPETEGMPISIRTTTMAITSTVRPTSQNNHTTPGEASTDLPHLEVRVESAQKMKITHADKFVGPQGATLSLVTSLILVIFMA
ncbi:hypothetical protein L596_010121 [Steinernema carpocapsae]|uniref:Uncharacterized protein n=1 Tax=Steinernema carpocapsae TaxID=34508 RepID=A0A4U5PIP7_STECR|nr:hypothetical protein L596_010121 [Steinernema carpocapsae]